MENGFIILFGLSMLYLAATSRIIAHIRLIIAQGLLLFLICACNFEHQHALNILFLTVETLIVKTVVIPWFLYRVLKKTKANRDVPANIPHFYCLVISSLILLAGFLIPNYFNSASTMKMISPFYFGVAFATIVISLWLITIKHKIISNVIEFITMENGIFLLSLSVAKEMPILVNMGVLLDVFIAIYILGLFINEINREFHDLEVSHLSDLKDNE